MSEVIKEIQVLVHDFFNHNDVKIGAWYMARSPLFGDVSPYEMIKTGRAEMVLRVIKNNIEGNLP